MQPYTPLRPNLAGTISDLESGRAELKQTNCMAFKWDRSWKLTRSAPVWASPLLASTYRQRRPDEVVSGASALAGDCT